VQRHNLADNDSLGNMEAIYRGTDRRASTLDEIETEAKNNIATVETIEY
jgi:hypothetical protein